MEWARDSAFRFFPLMEHDDLGLTLHPFDLASNKVLALVGRLEVRDWVDAISSHERLQPLGYLLWAACGKDPGFGPGSLLEHARRTTHYSAPEIAQLAFEGSPPDAHALAVTWRTALEQAAAIIDELPYEHAGTASWMPAPVCLAATRRRSSARSRRTPFASMQDRSAARIHVC